MISQQEKSAIRQMLQTPNWRITERIANELIQEWQNQTKLGNTEWETARNVVRDEGRCEGIKLLIQELFRLAQNENA